MAKRLLCAIVATFIFSILCLPARAELGGQVFFRYALPDLDNPRGNEVFTDTLGAAGLNNDDGQWAVSAGLDIPITTAIGSGTLLGEVMLEYARFSDKKVRQTTSALLGGTANSNVTVSELMVVVAPKYRLEYMDGKLRPWIIPAGVAFLVNSPPTDDTTYLDIGYHLGLGVEYRLSELISLGLDYRHTIASGEPDIKTTYSTLGLYLGFNF